MIKCDVVIQFKCEGNILLRVICRRDLPVFSVCATYVLEVIDREQFQVELEVPVLVLELRL